MKSAVAQAILLLMTMGLFTCIIKAMTFLSEGHGAEAVISLSIGAVFYMLIPTLEEPEQSHDPYDF